MSNKREQALRIEPKTEIHFKGPYNRVVTEYFHLANPTDKSIAFKVKTTAPKRYCVRPNNGIISPGKSVNVAVMLQPQGEGQTAATPQEKNKHKFMIQSVFASGDSGNADDMFKSIPTEDIMDSKFRCVFDDTPAAGTNDRPAAAGGKGGWIEPENASSNEGNAAYKEMADGKHDVDTEVSSSHTSPTSVAQNATSLANDLSHITNGGEEDFAASRLTSAYTTAAAPSSTLGGDSDSAKRLAEENRELRLKLQEFERASRSAGPGAYSRFPSSASSQPKGASSGTSSASTATTNSVNLFEQPLSREVIITVLISLFIGFFLGKVDLGLF